MSVPVNRAPYPFRDSVGRQIKEARARRRLSLRELAAEAAVSRRHLAELEKGSNVSLSVARNAMRALGLAVLTLDDENHQVRITSLAEVAAQLELGAALILQACEVTRGTAQNSSVTAQEKNGHRSDLATRAAALINEFEAYVRTRAAAEKVETLSRLVQASLAPLGDTTTNTGKRRRRSAI